MNALIADIWPYLISGLIAAVGWQFRESYLLKTKVAVMETTLDGLQKTMDKDIDEIRKEIEKSIANILKTIETIQKRIDSHSKKQDDIMDLLTDFKMEMVKEVGKMSSNVSMLTSDLKNLNNLISITDIGLKLDKGGK